MENSPIYDGGFNYSFLNLIPNNELQELQDILSPVITSSVTPLAPIPVPAPDTILVPAPETTPAPVPTPSLHMPVPATTSASTSSSVVEKKENVCKVKLGRRNLTRHQLEAKEKIGKNAQGPQCTHYVKDYCSQSKSQSNHVLGICKKMRDFSVTTNDNVLVEFHQVGKVRRFATNPELFKQRR